MSAAYTNSHPVRVSIMGAGPAGFYAAGHLLKQKNFQIEVDMFDRPPTPYGLIQGGVAPDHQKIKTVTRTHAQIAKKGGFCYFRNVEFGRDIPLNDLKRHYHQVVFVTGAQTGRKLNIPGRDLAKDDSASDFVAWYNGHPDYSGLKFDLSQGRIAIVGVGNVALDVAWILCRSTEELQRTDIVLDEIDEYQYDEMSKRIKIGLQEQGIAVPSIVTINDRKYLHVAITNYRSRWEDFDLLVKEVIRLGREFSKKISES